MPIKKKAYMVIDVETFDIVASNKKYNRTICNLGLTVGTRDGEIINQKDIFINDIIDLPTEPNNGRLPKVYIKREYYKKGVEVARAVGKKSKEVSRFKDAFNIVDNMVSQLKESYNVELWSYNAQFDFGAFLKNASYSGFKIPEWYGDNWYDLWRYTANLLLARPSYVKFAMKNELLTASGKNISTSAESAYRYLINDPEFEEEHTGMADSEIEFELLMYCLRQGKKAEKTIRGDPGQPWRIVKNYIEDQDRKEWEI